MGVRTSVIYAVKTGTVAWPLLDTFATSLGAILGEAMYWLIKSPSIVIKTRCQADAVQEEPGSSGPSICFDSQARKQVKNIIVQAIKAWPVLAFTDVPFVGLRVAIFVALHDSELIPRGVTDDALLFLFANLVAVLLTTPLDVV